MNTKQILGLVLFMVFLFISVIDFVIFFRAGTLTSIEQIAALLNTTITLNLISKLLIVIMFGLIFLWPEEKDTS
ncbi:MAG: hypothetical protein ACFFFO_15380 [Candidatus Thorarchaeota archaeon]